MKNYFLNIPAIFLLVSMCFPVFSQKTATKKVDFGKGISYTAKDSTFKVKFNFRMQHLYLVDYNEAAKEYTSQFLIRRSRIKFGGFALTPNLQYKVELGLSNRDISVDKEAGNTRDAGRIILDAVLKYQFVKNWTLWVGQTKLPGNRERVISSANLQFVDRSLLNSRYNIDRDFGLQIHGKFEFGKAIITSAFSLAQGEGRDITSSNFGGLGYTAHLDFLPFGQFTNKGDFIASDQEREQSPKLAIGFTFDYNDRAARQGGQLGNFVTDSMGEVVENSLSTFFVDLMFKYKGFSILSEYANKSAEKQLLDTSHGFLTGTGFSAQAGYLFTNNWEIALRFASVRKDDDFSGISDEDQYTFGLSKYIVGHNLKIQSDFTQRTFPDDADGRYQFRVQVEFQF